MDAVSILLVLAAAGQTGWTPERSAAPPPASAPEYDRYAQPPAASATGVGPPPSVVDRTRTAITESGTTLRDGFEAGVRAANEQLQGWAESAGQQLRTTGDNLRGAVGSNSASQVSNPFGAATSAPPAASAASRNGVAPPPWTDSPTTSAPSWSTGSTESGPSFGGTSSPGLQPVRTDSGWTSIGSQVAAPPLLVPRLTTSTSTAPLQGASVSSNASSTAAAPEPAPRYNTARESSQQSTPPASGADSWATGWGNNADAPPATISRSTADTSVGSAKSGNDLTPNQTADARSQDSQPQPNNSWDLWGKNDPWEDSRQTPPASRPAQEVAATASATPQAPDPASQPLIVAPANNLSTPATATGVLQTSTGLPPAAGSVVLPTPATEQPPWMPLLVVSLSLAGSLGANLFLGWSYLDARQRYRSLVRKTADKFRRATKAAA